MDSIEIRRPVFVKAIVTESFRKLVLDDTESAVKNHEAMFKQMEELYEKNKNIAAAPLLEMEKRILLERARLAEIKKEMAKRISDFKAVPEGEEILFNIMEGTVSVKVGDDLKKTLSSAEIVMKDFKVVELRGF